MRHLSLVILFICGLLFAAKAQQADTLTTKSKTDSAYRKKDSDPSKRFVPKVKKEKLVGADSTHSVHRAWVSSAILPGLGQIYNHHWWKVPAIYVGLGMLGNAIITNHTGYKDFLAVAKYRVLGKPTTDPYYAGTSDHLIGLYKQYGDNTQITYQAIVDYKDQYFRNEEISILSFVVVWGVNVIDAYIYGKLQHSFSMDNNFTIKVSGTTLEQPMYASNFNFNNYNFTPALKVTLTFR